MAEGNISSLLNKVWAEFRRAGVTDDLRIIEAVAALLLERAGITPTPDLPRRQFVSDLSVTEIQQWLREAAPQAGSPATLFDRFVLFRLSDMRAGGQYVTPRHIVKLMVALAETQGKRIADFACGSAGLLVHSSGRALTGVEISPEWARIARANLHLHGRQGEIHEGNALRVVGKLGEKFACILMNPPFGAKIKSDFGTRSETALITLALNHLAEDGRAALLVPSGLLFSGSQAEMDLRHRLVDKAKLEAVITLPDDAFQPYSTLTTHLLLVENTLPGNDAFTWFLRPVYDGYVSGRGRDLTDDPQPSNDLILTEKAVAAFRRPLKLGREMSFDVQYLLDKPQTLWGMLIRSTPEVNLITARYLPSWKDQPALLLLEVFRETHRAFWKVPLTADMVPEVVEDAEALILERLDLKKPADIPSADIFQSQNIRWGQSESQHVGGILIKVFDAEKPQLMGVAIPGAALRARGYTLQPDDYLRAPEISAALQRPHDILLDIHERQRELNQRMEKLAGWVTPERPKEHVIPAPVIEQQPFGTLSQMQQAIWEWIAAEKDGGGSAKPFTLTRIAVECGEGEKRLALAVFEAMGLIVPITLKNPASDQRMNFYRLAEESDKWAGAEGEEA